MEELKALLAYLEMTKDVVCLEDVLYSFLALLGRQHNLSAVVDHVYELGGCEIFLSLMTRYLRR